MRSKTIDGSRAGRERGSCDRGHGRVGRLPEFRQADSTFDAGTATKGGGKTTTSVARWLLSAPSAAPAYSPATIYVHFRATGVTLADVHAVRRRERRPGPARTGAAAGPPTRRSSRDQIAVVGSQLSLTADRNGKIIYTADGLSISLAPPEGFACPSGQTALVVGLSLTRLVLEVSVDGAPDERPTSTIPRRTVGRGTSSPAPATPASSSVPPLHEPGEGFIPRRAPSYTGVMPFCLQLRFGERRRRALLPAVRVGPRRRLLRLRRGARSGREVLRPVRDRRSSGRTGSHAGRSRFSADGGALARSRLAPDGDDALLRRHGLDGVRRAARSGVDATGDVALLRRGHAA